MDCPTAVSLKGIDDEIFHEGDFEGSISAHQLENSVSACERNNGNIMSMKEWQLHLVEWSEFVTEKEMRALYLTLWSNRFYLTCKVQNETLAKAKELLGER